MDTEYILNAINSLWIWTFGAKMDGRNTITIQVPDYRIRKILTEAGYTIASVHPDSWVLSFTDGTTKKLCQIQERIENNGKI